MKVCALLGIIALLLGGSAHGQVGLGRPPVSLNHFFVTVDSATYKEIEGSAFLRGEFAVTERRTTVRTDTSYTGIYFYGTNTYFEFFDAGDRQATQFNGSGVAFGVDVTGGLQALAQELPDEIFVAPQPVTRQYDGKQVPWFYRAVPKNFPLGSGVSVWLMEYHPRFLAEWNPRPDQAGGVSRQQILRRYAAVLKDVPARPLLEDVVSLTIAADEPTRKGLTGLGRLFGYSENKVGDATALKGAGDELRLIAVTGEARGVRAVTMRVRGKPKGQTEFRFGPKSVLKFHGDGLATWSF